MAKLVEFITRLDLDALADGQLVEERENAVRRHLEKNDGAFHETAKMNILNEVLKLAKPGLYQDRALREAVEGLLRRRAA